VPKEGIVTGARIAVRTAVRFPLKLALHIKTADGIIEAITKDVSSNGLLFAACNLPEIGSRIEFTMDMPSAVMGTATDVTIHCTGRVVRHQHSETESMAAAVIDQYTLKA
jgi:PilZ domain